MMRVPFACDLKGSQRLQIWYLSRNSWYQNEDLQNLSILETRLYCRGCENAAGFPYSPYASGQFGQDWLRALQGINYKH